MKTKKITTNNIWEEMFKANIKKKKYCKPKMNIWETIFYERYYKGDKSCNSKQ